MSFIHHTKLQINQVVTAAILIFILLQMSSSPLQSDGSSPLLSNLVPSQSCFFLFCLSPSALKQIGIIKQGGGAVSFGPALPSPAQHPGCEKSD